MTDEKFKELFNQHGPPQNQFELKNLFDWLEVFMPNPKTIVEIGVFKGGTFTFWKNILDNEGLLVGVDLNDRGYIDSLAQNYSEDRNVKFISGYKSNDRICIQKVKEALEHRPIDILFIDASHVFEDVQADYDIYSKFVRKGGLIIFHDIVGPELLKGTEVWMLWRYLKYNIKYEGIIEFFGHDNPCGIGVMIK